MKIQPHHFFFPFICRVPDTDTESNPGPLEQTIAGYDHFELNQVTVDLSGNLDYS